MYTIIGTPTCPYCTNAKALLDQKQLPFEYKMMNDLTSGQMTELETIAGTPFRTVPQIFKEEDGQLMYVGGFTELAQSFRTTS